jgi:redox-regulated HSP33 family molecular chaperone
VDGLWEQLKAQEEKIRQAEAAKWEKETSLVRLQLQQEVQLQQVLAQPAKCKCSRKHTSNK